ncbi:MAG: glycogen synthase [Chloroflexota bacterium]
MRILFASAEASPLVKVGGLADVIGSLPRALTDLGHEVRTVIPAYSFLSLLDNQPQDSAPFAVHLPTRSERASVQSLTLDRGRYFYLIRDSGLLCGPQVYTDNDLERFLFFNRAVFDLLPQLNWQPEIVHCHDWHTALVPMWLKHSDLPYASVFTIHNLAYQGTASWDFLTSSGLSRFWENLPPEILNVPSNFMAQGILCADAITTVSETYAREITTPEFGDGLDAVLRYRQNDLSGIINGIDPDEFNPAVDCRLAVKYDKANLEGKHANKLALQRRFRMTENADIPLIGMVSRLDEQKGFDIIEPALDQLSQREVQFIILGRGQERYETVMREAAASHPDKMAAVIDFVGDLASLIYAGSDVFLMPSRFEPCGLGQMIAMRYGAVPVVRRTGGLADTVPEVNPNLSEGRGFVFNEYHTDAMLAALDRALTAYYHRDAWDSLVRRIMSTDFSWRASVMKYEAVYKKALEARRRAQN